MKQPQSLKVDGRNRPRKKWLRAFTPSLLLGLLLLLLLGLPTLAASVSRQVQILDQSPLQVAPPSQPRVAAAPTAPGLDDPQEFAAFVDQFFSQEMPANHVPGAAISVVKDGQLFFARGYGYANLEQNIPVDVKQTLFRVASLSKLFTATAAMQLYERGMLDLDADVNQYLRQFQIQNPFRQPVTPARIMTHTDGTTKRLLGLAAPTSEELQPLGDYLAEHLPAIVWPPGRLYSYSSHSMALLGYLVQEIAGVPFLQYVDQNIFQPLAMQRSTFAQPPPPTLVDDLAVGYQYQNGQFQPVPFLYLNIGPAAAMSATATDMAKFMIAHLQLGRYQDSHILQPETVRLMQQQHFTHHPLLPGTGYSFRERLENQLRAIGHLGSLRGYSSSLTLLPDQNIGIFVASNSFSGIHDLFLSQFFDRYFPVTQPVQPLQPLNLTAAQLERFTGTYWDVEYPRRTAAKLAAPFERIQITQGGDGTLVIQTPRLFFVGSLRPIRLLPVGPLLFRQAEGEGYVAFAEDALGQITFAFNPVFPKIGAYQRVGWWANVWLHLGWLGFCAIAFLVASLVWPVLPLVQKLRGKASPLRQNYRVWVLMGGIGILNLVFLVGLPLTLRFYGFWKLAYGVPGFAIAFFCLPLLSALLTLGLIPLAAWGWKQQEGTGWGRSLYTLVTLATISLIPLLGYWNLLGFHF